VALDDRWNNDLTPEETPYVRNCIEQGGREYWESGGEYLMSDEFMDEYLREGLDPYSRSVRLIRAWTIAGLTTYSFIYAWEAEDRKEGAEFLKKVIKFYRQKLEGLKDHDMAGQLELLIHDRLEIIARNFEEPPRE
jgi:hypothetical protein